ncbi:GNAT family N-acetyltransferase [Streptacidiphilus monticola]
MTTTLRPEAAEARAADGSRARAYAICVNGRPVGRIALELRAAERGVAEITELFVEPEGRGRGRGTTAVLAAEEVLREWGADRVMLNPWSRRSQNGCCGGRARWATDCARATWSRS